MQFWRLTTVSQEAGTPLQGSYDPSLVILSVFVASLAGFVALSVSDRIIASDSRFNRWSWLSFGSIAMGTGVWAMHFTGMLAYSLPITVKYDLVITMVSVVPAIIGSGAALYTMADSSINWRRLQVGALFMASCIGTMHYTGMEAMRMPAILHYDLFMFVLSLLVAHLLSSVALYIKFIIDPMLSRFRTGVLGIASLLIGLAVSGLHYTALEAALIYPDETATGFGGAYLSSTALMVSILLTSTLIMIGAIVATIVNVKFNVAYRARERTQRQLNMALDAAQAGVWKWNPETNEEVWDDNFRDLMGIDEELDPSHENFIRQVIPEDRERVRSEISDALEDSDSYKIEFRVNTNGATRWIQAIGRVQSEPNEPTRIAQGIVLDVTDRKQAERDLQDSEQRFRQMSENIEQVFWLSTVHKEMLYVSPAFEQIWGSPVETVFGGDDLSEFFERIHPDDRDRIRNAIHQKQIDGDYDEEYRIVRPDGEVRWIHDQVFPVRNENGEVIRLAGIAEDITERKMAEKALKDQQEELEKTLEERTTLFQEVHHRVKNNLQMIISLLDLQQRDSSGSSSGDSSLQDIKNRIQSMALIHEHVYEQASISEIDAEQYLSTLIDHIVQGQVPPYLELTVDKDIEPLELHLDTLLPCGIVTNELITNALQHGFEGRDEGKVEFEFRRLDETRFELLIADNGAGLPPDVSFEDSTSLGLNLVRRLVQNQLNGSIEQLESDAGLSLRLVLKDVRTTQDSVSSQGEMGEGKHTC